LHLPCTVGKNAWMPAVNVRPLDAALWFESLGQLQQEANSRGSRIENRLRQSYYLANLAPPPYSAVARCDIGEVEFEALLESAAFEAAAIALIGQILSFEVIRIPLGGEVTARVWIGEVSGEAQTSSGCAASALVRAWLTLLLRLREREPVLNGPEHPRDQHRSLSEPPRKPILH
jgi:hypothetical protein